MSYALVKNTRLNEGLFDRDSVSGRINWSKYGLKFSESFGTAQGYNAAGQYLNIIKIFNEGPFDAYLPSLVAYCESTERPDDTIEKITDEEAEILKATIVPVE